MGRLFPRHRGRTAAAPPARTTTPRVLAALFLLATTASCSAVIPAPGASPPASAAPRPVTAGINQFRDNYSRRIIEIQLTNNTAGPLTVLAAELESPLFPSGISWPAPGGGMELPPGQPKSLPAALPAPDCGQGSAPAGSASGTAAAVTATPGPADAGPGGPATVSLRLAGPEGRTEQQAAVPAPDPYGVLTRNNAEMCLAQAAAAVAGFRLEPDLEVSADGRTAVVRLTITPRRPAGGQLLTVDRIEGTTLLAEDQDVPWPRSVTVGAGGLRPGPATVLRLRIRPARCDPHAVAEDKVGTLLPLRVRVGGREGILKVDAGGLLRGRIYDFVTSACGRQ
ncbi:hypothetical protein [Pseudarthrobacter albicanus]|uniref:hypothetical protein n=1 Tax=Pseudarthrobacter albicanus TaxID=2823873 RepID=UPI001FE807CF|nr:hypothetical protein [Pseudarthrobacter albicanus]